MLVQFLKILDQIVDSLCVQKLDILAPIQIGYRISYLANNLRWLGVIDGFEILLHGAIVIPFLVHKVTVLTVDHILLLRIHPGLLG